MEKEKKIISNDKPKQGKKNRAAGARFELKVRGEFEKNGWIIDRWSNNVDTKTNTLVKSKRKFNPFLKTLSIGTGFPDFIGFKLAEDKKNYKVIGIEVKTNGWLDKSEKEKCQWCLDNKIFSKIIIARKGKKRGEIIYVDFSERRQRE